LLLILLNVSVPTAVSTNSIWFLKKANCPWLLKMGRETAKNGVAVAVGVWVGLGVAGLAGLAGGRSNCGQQRGCGWFVALAGGEGENGRTKQHEKQKIG
jgi:hypothetical protein